MNSKTLWVGASAGGHTTQLLTLLKHAIDWPVKPTLYITTNEIMVGKMRTYGYAENIGECNRLNFWKSFLVFLRSIALIFNHNYLKPDIIVTTGSLPLAILCLVAKIKKTKIVWIDSIANVEELSMSGKLMYLFADLFIVQWKDLASKYSKAEYIGEII